MVQTKVPIRKKASTVLSKERRERAIMETYLEDMITIPNAAIKLGISPQSVRNAILDGRIPPSAVVDIDRTYRVLLWSQIKDLQMREYYSDRKHRNND